MPSFVIHGAAQSPYVRVYAWYWSPLKKTKPLHAELKRLDKPPIATEPVVDTLVLAALAMPSRR